MQRFSPAPPQTVWRAPIPTHAAVSKNRSHNADHALHDRSHRLSALPTRPVSFPVFIHDPAQQKNQIDVLPLVVPADICFTINTFMINNVDSRSVVDHPEPVAHIFTLSVNRQGLFRPDVVDKKRNQLRETGTNRSCSNNC